MNRQEFVTLLCSPAGLTCLAVGFLSSEGLLKSKDEIEKILVDEQRGGVRLEMTGGRGIHPGCPVQASDIFGVWERYFFFQRCLCRQSKSGVSNRNLN